MRASRRRTWKTPLAAAALAVLLWGAGGARAELMLTSDGSAAGFGLSLFANHFQNWDATGPLGIAFPASGGALVADFTGPVESFPTLKDGQEAGTGMPRPSYGMGNPAGLAQVGGNIYMAQRATGAVVQLNANGTFNQTIIGGLSGANGLVANPANGHLFVSTTGAGAVPATVGGAPGVVFEVNPLTRASTPFLNVALEGMAISPDGKTLYGATGAGVVGYDIATGAQVFDSGPIAGGPDGIALGMGTLGGKLFVNTNAGQVIELDLATLAQTIIAAGGSRGDFTTPAPDGTLLLTQTDTVMRLTPPGGGSFFPLLPDAPLASVPEPSSLALVGLGGLALAGCLCWRKKAPA